MMIIEVYVRAVVGELDVLVVGSEESGSGSCWSSMGWRWDSSGRVVCVAVVMIAARVCR